MTPHDFSPALLRRLRARLGAFYYLVTHRRSLRRARRLVLSLHLWQRRLVFWAGAAMVGVIACLFASVADRAQQLFARILEISELLPLLLTPTLFALAAYGVQKYFYATQGSGIPQAIAARSLSSAPEARRYLLGPRVILGKMALTALVLIGGASVGREGPTVQVAAAIMLLCGTMGGLQKQKDLVLVGAAAGVAAAFNTPLAGIVFAIEEMARSFERRNINLVLTAIVLAGVAAMSIKGNYDYFGTAEEPFQFVRDGMAVIVVAAICGLIGGLFARVMTDGARRLRNVNGGFGLRHPVYFAGICGFLVAAIGIMTHGTTYGTGYSVANDLLHERNSVSWGYAAAKFAATALSNFSGVPGGLFSPSLTVGAALGSSLQPWFDQVPLQLVVLLGMTSYFSGVTQAPITAFVIVLEATGKDVMPAPLIAAAVIGAAAARILSPKSLYHVLAASFVVQAQAAVKAPAPEPEGTSATQIAS